VGPAVPQFGPIPQLPELAGLPKNTTILQLLIGSMMAMLAGTLFGTTFVLLGFDELVFFTVFQFPGSTLCGIYEDVPSGK